jgi:histone acetyltransferase (RNA polymerase elongator complex component)
MFASLLIKKTLTMKRILIAVAVIALFISVVSCKKCVTCKYQYLYLDDTVKVSQGSCGKSSEIKDFKAAQLSTAELQGVNSITCTDNK